MKRSTTAAERPLREYNAKRNFHSTPEPAGETGAGAERARFVVQEHHARSLHWDLRLERDGVLVSWAVPKGIPQDPKTNHLAVHVEDHPIDYIDFAGEIPKGSYGAGSVKIWDSGTYETHKFRDDEVIVTFHGERLQGKYVLFQTNGKNWMIHRMDPPHGGPREPMPEELSPMLAKPSKLPASEQDYGYEIKWDGIRALAFIDGGRVRLENRNGRDITRQYPELRELGKAAGAMGMILDGEVVCFDEHGHPSFEQLQHRMHLTSESVIRRRSHEALVTYVIFDLLYLDGHSTMALSYSERRSLLEQLHLEGTAWQTPAYHSGSGKDFLAVSAEHGLEGIVAKRLDSPYRPGQRTGEWLKIKNVNRQEFVIGGWQAGKGRRAGLIGSLLVGYYSEHDGRQVLRYAGGVGTGFDEHELQRLTKELEDRPRPDSPFAPVGTQPPASARFVEPELVAEVEFSHWTKERILRHSVYKGLRDDKPAAEVAVEQDPGVAGAQRPYEILNESKNSAEIEAGGRTLKLSNRSKVLYPEAVFTKGQVVDYYAAVAPVLLGHLAGRPLTLKRYPDGVKGKYFYEKRCPSHRPEWVHTAAVQSEREGVLDYCVLDDLPALIWVANLASLELHPSLSRAADIVTPTAVVFDLDPGAPAGLKQCCQVALWLRELFAAFDLEMIVKTSGAKGLQVYVPLNAPIAYEQTKPFARAVAGLIEKDHPKLVTSRMTKQLRHGKVFIDWSQNDQHKTTICVYSLRARERPTISTPLQWEEVQAGAVSRKRDLNLSAEPSELLRRIDQHGDLFTPFLSLTQTLPELTSQ
ncbi:MAG TPA: DNA ligase D [Solirubrobacteraceae bacterium]|nr:DNA ligase D [Solirubrobacteraceae bacterium]